jgi:hypothetical protein
MTFLRILASILKGTLCALAIIIALSGALMYSLMPDPDYTLSFDVDFDHVTLLKLEYLRRLASITLHDTDAKPYGKANIADAFQLFRQVGNISGGFSDFIYSLSDAATSQDILHGPGIVYGDKFFDEYTYPLAQNKATNMDEDFIYLAINISFVISHYAQEKPRLSERDLLSIGAGYCFFGDRKSLIENEVLPFELSDENKEMAEKYYVGIVFNSEMFPHDAFYIKAFTAMKDGVYFADLNENPYNGGSVLITSIPFQQRGE